MTQISNASQRARVLLLLVVTAILMAACGQDNAVNNAADESTIRPAPITTASGQQCQPWINNPGEVDGSGIRACDYPIPQDRPVRQPGMSDADWFLLGAMFSYGLGHHDYYYSDRYYRNYIGPAWNRHPGSYYGYGRQPIVRITNYNTTINHVNTTYAADEKRAVADPKYSGYKSASGKMYNGTTVPKQTFKSSNVTPTGPAGDARSSTTQQKQTTQQSTKPSTTGGSTYTKGSSSSSSSGRSSSTSSGSSSHSSGGHR